VGSAAEQLIGNGFAVGISGPGFFVPPGNYERQFEMILMELAKMSFDNHVPRAVVDFQTVQISMAHRGVESNETTGTQIWVEDCLEKTRMESAL